MRVVRVKLVKPNSFWFMNNLHLGPDNPMSEPFDWDALDSVSKDKIEKAANKFGLVEIWIQPDETAPTFVVEKSKPVNYVFPQRQAIRKIVRKKTQGIDIPEPIEKGRQEDLGEEPDIRSVTLDEPLVAEEPQDLEPPEIEETKPTEEDYEDARSLLQRNGNTVKRLIRDMSKPADEMKRLLLACLEVEKEDKKRKGVKTALEKAYLEVS